MANASSIKPSLGLLLDLGYVEQLPNPAGAKAPIYTRSGKDSSFWQFIQELYERPRGGESLLA